MKLYYWVCFVVSFIFSQSWLCFVYEFRYDADDREVDSEGEDDEVNGNEDGEGGGNEEDSEDGWLKIWSCVININKNLIKERCLLIVKK